MPDSRPYSQSEREYIAECYFKGMKPDVIGKQLGRTAKAIIGQAYLMKITKNPDYTLEEKQKIIDTYNNPQSEDFLNLLAVELKRPKENISRFARRLGLTSYNRSKHDIVLRGMKTKEKNGTLLSASGHNKKYQSGWRTIAGYKKFYRSKWEANYAWFLQWMKEQKQIADWKHEPKTFWFDKIKRGVRSYTPDFCVKYPDGSEQYHEVKGWMDKKSATKIKRMATYHPNVTIVLIDKAWFDRHKDLRRIVPGWGT